MWYQLFYSSRNLLKSVIINIVKWENSNISPQMKSTTQNKEKHQHQLELHVPIALQYFHILDTHNQSDTITLSHHEKRSRFYNHSCCCCCCSESRTTITHIKIHCWSNFKQSLLGVSRKGSRFQFTFYQLNNASELKILNIFVFVLCHVATNGCNHSTNSTKRRSNHSSTSYWRTTNSKIHSWQVTTQLPLLSKSTIQTKRTN